jgi:hypothetical protein
VGQGTPGWQVGVGEAGHPGGWGHRVGVAVLPPFGKPIPLTGNAAMTAPLVPFGAVIAVTAATVLSSAISITTGNAKNRKYNLPFLGACSSLFIYHPSLLVWVGENRCGRRKQPHIELGCMERRELNEEMTMLRSIQVRAIVAHHYGRVNDFGVG